MENTIYRDACDDSIYGHDALHRSRYRMRGGEIEGVNWKHWMYRLRENVRVDLSLTDPPIVWLRAIAIYYVKDNKPTEIRRVLMHLVVIVVTECVFLIQTNEFLFSPHDAKRFPILRDIDRIVRNQYRYYTNFKSPANPRELRAALIA